MDNIDLSDFIKVKCKGFEFDNYVINPHTCKIYNTKSKRFLKLSMGNVGYYSVSLILNRKHFSPFIHRLVFESVHGEIPKGYVIDHIDNKKTNNSINNLQMITQKENIMKSVAHRPTRITQAKAVKATNLVTNDIQYFKSQYNAGQVLGVQPMCVNMICNGVLKTTRSKKDEMKYTFEYITSQSKQSPSVP